MYKNHKTIFFTYFVFFTSSVISIINHRDKYMQNDYYLTLITI